MKQALALRRLAGLVSARVVVWLVSCGLVALSVVGPAQARCPDGTTPTLSRGAESFLAPAAESTGAAGVSTDVRDLHARASCGDTDAVAALESLAARPDVRLQATGALVDAGKQDAIVLLDGLRRASVPLDRKAGLLSAIALWLASQDAKVSPEDVVRDTAWAVNSGHEELARVATELRATHGDSTALDERAERLMACATQADGEIGFDCLAWHELHTASLAPIAARWSIATDMEKVWLARWSRRAAENQQFLLARLADETSDVQYEILAEVLDNEDSLGLAIQGALLLLDQALAEPARRPLAVPIDFEADAREGYFGINAYAASGGYPSALQAAFDELATYPDSIALMSGLAALDHPWLATQAGMWLVRHGETAQPEYVLRHALEDDGLPAARVLNRTVPLDGGIPSATRQLFLQLLAMGSLGKWNVLAVRPFETLLDDSAVIDAILARIATLPERVANAGIASTLDDAPPERSKSQERMDDELRAMRWAVSGSQGNSELLGRYLDALAELHAPLWKAIALTMAIEFGDLSRARHLAPLFIDAKPPKLREAARMVLATADP